MYLYHVQFLTLSCDWLSSKSHVNKEVKQAEGSLFTDVLYITSEWIE